MTDGERRDQLSGFPSRASPFASGSYAASFARSWELRRRPLAFEMERNGRISRRSGQSPNQTQARGASFASQSVCRISIGWRRRLQ